MQQIIRKVTRAGSDNHQQEIYSLKNIQGIPPAFRNQQTKKRRRTAEGRMSALREAIDEAKLFFETSCFSWKKTEDGYLFLTRDIAPEMFKCLDPTKIFKFHETNKKEKIIYQHQVSKYLSVGWKLYNNGYYACKGEIDNHHLDSNRENNDPRNLRYVSSGLNYVISKAIRQPYLGKIPTSMTETPEEANYLRRLTFKRTLKRLGYHLNKSEREFLLTLDWDVKQKILETWQPPEEVYKLEIYKLLDKVHTNSK